MAKEVVLMVGPPGSGKTTYALKLGGTRISQDDDGKKHLQLYKAAFKQRKPLIVVDRTNLTDRSRAEYIQIAEANGYKVQLIMMDTPYDVCLERLQKRGEHPTLPNGDPNIEVALKSAFAELQIPRDLPVKVIEYDNGPK